VIYRMEEEHAMKIRLLSTVVLSVALIWPGVASGQPAPKPSTAPASTDPTTIRKLSSANTQERLAAAKALAGRTDAESFKALARVVGDKDLRVSETAASALERSKSPLAVQALLDSLPAVALDEHPPFRKGPPSPQEELLMSFSGAWLDKPLLAGLKHTSEQARLVAVKMLAKRVTEKDADPAIGPAVAELLIQERSRAVKSAAGGIRAATAASPASMQDHMKTYKEANDPRKRMEALKRLSTAMPAADFATLLVEALGNEDSILRSYAHTAIYRCRSKEAVPALLAGMKARQDDVRKICAQMLVYIKDPRSEDAMISALNDSSDSVRGMAAELLGELRSRKAVDGLIAVAGSLNSRASEPAIVALGLIGDKKAVETLLSMIEYREDGGAIQSAAIDALGKIGDRRAVPALMKNIKSDYPDADAVRALCRFGGDEVVDAVIKLYQPQTASGLNGAVIEGLGKTGHRKALEFLREQLEKEHGIRNWIVAALKDANDPALGRILMKLAKDPNEPDRFGAVMDLAEVETPAAVQMLIDLLGDKSEEFRMQVQLILVQRGDHKVQRELLIKALKHADRHIRAGAAMSLGVRRNFEAVEPLIELLTDSYHQARLNAMLALGMITDAKVERHVRNSKPQDIKAWWQKWWAKNKAKATRPPEKPHIGHWCDEVARHGRAGGFFSPVSPENPIRTDGRAIRSHQAMRLPTPCP